MIVVFYNHDVMVHGHGRARVAQSTIMTLVMVHGHGRTRVAQ